MLCLNYAVDLNLVNGIFFNEMNSLSGRGLGSIIIFQDDDVEEEEMESDGDEEEDEEEEEVSSSPEKK